MTVRDQPEPGVAGAAGDRAEPGDCGGEERRLRADAARNRAAIVAVARDVFAEHGLEAPLEAIAARAGVGIATLYRRFPSREKLVAAALVEKVAEYAEAARQALAVPDPWDGFAGFVERICELQAGDRGLSDLLSMTLSADEQVEELRRTANDLLITVIDRAKAAGTLREDFVGEDLVLLLIATAAVTHATRADAPEAWRRFVALALDSFSTRSASPRSTPALPDPPSSAQMTRAMIRLARDRGCGERALPRHSRRTTRWEDLMRNAALLGTRLVVGSYLAVHGAQKLFGAFGGSGLDRAGASFERMGLRPGRPMAAAAGITELGGGVLTAAGIADPAGPLAIMGAMSIAATTSRAKGPLNSRGGFELPLTNLAAAAALAAVGPGRFRLGPALPRPLAVAGALGGGLLAAGLVAKILTAKPVAPANPGAATESTDQPSGQVTPPQ